MVSKIKNHLNIFSENIFNSLKRFLILTNLRSHGDNFNMIKL